MEPGNVPRLIKVTKHKICKATKREEKQIKIAIKEVLYYLMGTRLQFDFVVCILNNREQMDFICGYKTPNWLCGKSDGAKKRIYIFQENLFEKLTSHHNSEFHKVLTHEIAHLYTKVHYQLMSPLWLHEGIAMAIAKQYKTCFSKKNIRLCHSYEEWKINPAYHSSCNFVEFLIDRYGKKKMFFLLKDAKNFKKRDEFYSRFKMTYGIEFNLIVNEWLKIKLN